MYKRVRKAGAMLLVTAGMLLACGSMVCLAEDGSDSTVVRYEKKSEQKGPGMETEADTGMRYVNVFSLNLRSGPSVEEEILGQLSMNQEVELLVDDETEFCQIKVNHMTGYVHQDYLSETKIETASLEMADEIKSKYASIKDLQDRVVSIARDNSGTRPCTGGMCAAWVSGSYQAAGLGYPGGEAIDYWLRWSESGSTSMEDIPVGAVVVGSGSGSKAGNKYGHVGIYLGDGMVAENIGRHRIISLEDWANTQVGTCRGYHGYIGWVWPYEVSLGDKVDQ